MKQPAKKRGKQRKNDDLFSQQSRAHPSWARVDADPCEDCEMLAMTMQASFARYDAHLWVLAKRYPLHKETGAERRRHYNQARIMRRRLTRLGYNARHHLSLWMADVGEDGDEWCTSGAMSSVVQALSTYIAMEELEPTPEGIFLSLEADLDAELDNVSADPSDAGDS